MANSRSALALISICILVSLSGLGDCRVPLQREQAVAGVEEKDQSVHLLLPSEKEQFSEIAREFQPLNFPLERPDLRGNDGIFHGERRRGFRFGRPGGCHHGKFNRRGQRMSDHMPFPVGFLDLQAESRDFHPRMGRPFPEERDFDHDFPKGGWKHPGGEKRGRENEHMPFPPRGWLEFLLHPFPRHDHPAGRDFHRKMDRPLPEMRHFDPGFPKGEWRHPEEGKRGEEHEHMPFPARGGWLEFFFHPFLRHDDHPEFHPREGEFRREFGHGFPRADEFHPRKDEFRPEFGHGFPRADGFHPRVDEFRAKFGHGFPNGGEGRQHRDEFGPEFGHGFPRMDKFHPRIDEFMPEFGHGFPNGGEGRQHRDEFRPEFGHGFPRMDKFHPRVDETGDSEQMPFPEEREESFPHAFPVQAKSKEFRSRVGEFVFFPRERDFEHGFPGREGRQPGHGHGHGEEEKEIEHLPFQIEFPVQAESTEFRSGGEEVLPLPRERDFEHSFPGGDQQYRGPFKTE